MPNKNIDSLRAGIKAKIEKATEADEIAALNAEEKALDDLEKDYDGLEKKNKDLATAYREALKSGKSTRNEETGDDDGDDDGDDETGKGSDGLSFDQAISKILAKRKKE